MRLRRDWGAPPGPCALTIGNFDGVHQGHIRLLDHLRGLAPDLPLVVLTFEPHPLATLDPGRAPPRLTDLRSKVKALAAAGADQVNVMRFTSRLAGMAAEAFIARLCAVFQVKVLAVGNDFRFGKGRAGDSRLLASLAGQLGFELAVVPDHRCAGGQRVSSKQVRVAVTAADFVTAGALLGRPYRFGGRVVHGNKMGRRLGCPTANLGLAAPPPLHGVYAAWAFLDEQRWPAALAVGNRPAVGGTRLCVEAHLIGFDTDIYGRYLAVEPVRWMRGERDFPDLDSLRQTMRQDIADCAQVLDNA